MNTRGVAVLVNMIYHVSADTDTFAIAIMISCNRTRQAGKHSAALTEMRPATWHFYSRSAIQTAGVTCVTAARQNRHKTAPRRPARCAVVQPSN